MDKELQKLIMDMCKEVSRELYEEESGEPNCVGAGKVVDLFFEGDEYKLEVKAFWEKCKYFDYVLIGEKLETKEFVAGYF